MKRRGFLGALIGGPAAVIAAEKVAATPVQAPVVEEAPLYTHQAYGASIWVSVSCGLGGVSTVGPIDRNPQPFWENRT